MPKFSIDPEILVKEAFPEARLVGGLHGKCWIDDGEGRILGSIQAVGTRELRRRMAWVSALEELSEHIRAQAKFFNNGKC